VFGAAEGRQKANGSTGPNPAQKVTFEEQAEIRIDWPPVA